MIFEPIESNYLNEPKKAGIKPAFYSSLAVWFSA